MAKSKQQLRIPISILLTDTHLHKSNVELVKDIFRQAIKICKELKINRIFHIGDFFTSREAQPLYVLLEAKEIFNEIKEAGLFLYIIPGNHDKTDLESTESYLHAVEKNDHINLIDDAAYIYAGEDDKTNVIWLPYFKEKGSYLSKLEQASKLTKKGKCNILLTHIGVNGVMNNDGSSVENNLKQEAFEKFDKVFVGHYHNQQDCGKINYIGSAYQANFGEDDIKGFTILYENGYTEFIKSKFPEFVKLKINIDDVINGEIPKHLLKESNDHIRVILTGDKTKLQAYNKQSLIDNGIDVKYESDEVKNGIENSDEIIVFDRKNINSAFKKFVKENEINDPEFGLKYLEQIL